MKYTQNTKLEQIQFDTAVIGIDIGKSTHYARIFDYRGVEKTKVLKFNNTAEGFAAFDKWLAETMSKHQFMNAVVGFEPTGHYWFSLGAHLKEQGHTLAIVNPFHVKRTKELDDNSPTKNDHKDPKTIAMLVKDGRYREVYIPENHYQELREVVWERERVVEQMTMLSNQIIRWLDIRFPEFWNVFGSWTRIAARATLRQFPTPDKVLAAGPEKILACWRKHITRAVGAKKLAALMEAAAASIGMKTGLQSAETSLQNMLDQYELLEKQLEDCMEQMAELLLEVPNAKLLLEIKGVGLAGLTAFVSEVGDVRRFEDPKQIQKLAGLNLVENSSGKHKGKTRISKRGRKRLRKALFGMMIPILARNEEFRELHQRNITREKNPLAKMQSVIALCGKLIRVFFGILKKGTPYSAEKMKLDMNPSMKAVA